MVLNLVNADVFGVDTNVFFTNDNDVERITEIIHNDKQLNINNVDDIKFAIDFIEKSKIDTNDKLLSTMGKAFFGTTSIFDKVNEVADSIISKLNDELNILLSNTCSCKVDDTCEYTSRTLEIARHYMDEVIDPHGTMPALEYNKMLAMFRMYNEWVMKR
jgi:superfamily II helicase